MHRYIVFCGASYYPDGGVSDINSHVATQEEAESTCRVLKKSYDWVQILDTATGQYTTFYGGEERQGQVK